MERRFTSSRSSAGWRRPVIACGWSAPAGPARRRRRPSRESKCGAGADGTASRCSGAAPCVARLAAERPDIVVEDINKLPLFLASATDLPFCVLVPHLFGETAFDEAPWPMAATVWLGERPLPRAYRRASFHAISESTRDDLVVRGVDRSRIRVIHPGVDGERYSPSPAEPRAPEPRFLYVGRLKRYKGISLAIHALAVARRYSRRPPARHRRDGRLPRGPGAAGRRAGPDGTR